MRRLSDTGAIRETQAMTGDETSTQAQTDDVLRRLLRKVGMRHRVSLRYRSLRVSRRPVRASWLR